MSLTDSDTGRGKMPMDIIGLGAVVLLAVLAMLFFTSGRSQQLRVAPTGFDGLTQWLTADGLDAQSFTGGWTIPAEEVGLSILPLYDTALNKARVPPTTKEELLLQSDEIDLQASTLRTKARLAPAIFVLPKWRSGVRYTGLAHPILLISGRDTSRLLGDLTGLRDIAPVRHIPAVQTEFAYTSTDGRRLNAQLYVAQTMAGEGCDPVIGRRGAMILGLCPMSTSEGVVDVHVLADPDLFSNHGLRLGDNAEIARDLLGDLAGEKRILVDYSRDNWLVEAATYTHPDRTWADLKRFFTYPFSLLWLGAVLTLGLFLWRGGPRFGPVEREGGTALAASKSVMIGARARLMRLTGQDGALLGAYAQARVASVTHRLLGPHQTGPDEAALMTLARRSNPALAVRLEEALERIHALPATLSAEVAITYVDELEHILEQLSDDT